MTTIEIRGVPVSFPFEPYELQKNYMEKVIESLQNQTHAVLESPTGTGKTLSLLCSTLAWLQMKKDQVQAEKQTAQFAEDSYLLQPLKNETEGVETASETGKTFRNVPFIIYASRTHAQLSQAMQELKKTAYKHMKACILGSRDYMCINEEIAHEQNNALKGHMCRVKVQAGSCHYYNRVKRCKEHQDLACLSVVDMEDLIRLGNANKFCPYYMTKELRLDADIIFMPYNYLFDPCIRKQLSEDLDFSNSVIILDEAHNIEQKCEDAASIQLKSSDITLAIEEVIYVMKLFSSDDWLVKNSLKDLDVADVSILKKMLLDFEKVLDDITVDQDGKTFDGTFIFEMFEKASIFWKTHHWVVNLLFKMIELLTKISQRSSVRRGYGLQHLEEMLRIIFVGKKEDVMEKIQRCCKVYIVEEIQKRKPGKRFRKAATKTADKIVNYWCFSPGFGMTMFMATGLQSLILTSGTLAPLKPLISELELKVDARLENPHIVTQEQVCIKIVPFGPDNIQLNSNFYNRNNEDYIRSLGMSVLNLSKVIPDGLLIFFPSYPIMNKCQEQWEMKGIWSNIFTQKPIFVEPRDKNSFNTVMQEYYQKIADPAYKGAIFMGVCRGKVSEGLDFIDANGRAVIVIGLPYPPFKDKQVILKREYLDLCNSRDKECLRGEEWYSLEATRTVNQAIGRVIRHRNDYGAILLLDSRFNNFRVKNLISKWLRNLITVPNSFGELMKEIRMFFRNAEVKFPCNGPRLKPIAVRPAQFDTSKIYESVGSQPSPSTSNEEVTIHQRNKRNPHKRMKVAITNVDEEEPKDRDKATVMKEYIAMVKNKLSSTELQKFISALKDYNKNLDFQQLTVSLDDIFEGQFHLRYLILGLETYIKPRHRGEFQSYCDVRK